MKLVVQRWNAFWFARGPADALAIFRILFAACLANEVPTTLARCRTAIEGGFHLPYLGLIPLFTPELYEWVHTIQYPLIALLGVGLFTRTACASLVFLQGWVFFSDALHFRNHPYIFLLVLVLLLVSPCDEALSLKRLLAKWRNPPGTGTGSATGSQLPPLTAQRLIQVLICIAYFYSGLQKLNLDFLNGHVLSDLFRATLPQGTSGAILARLWDRETLVAWLLWLGNPVNIIPAAYATVFLELTLPFALWWRRTRCIAMVVGAGFHLSILVSMDIRTFSSAMIASYLLFLEPETVARWRSMLAVRVRSSRVSRGASRS